MEPCDETEVTPEGEPEGGFASLAGVWRGRVEIRDDFDELPAYLAEAFGIET